MIVRTWRLVKSKFATTAFDGKGAQINGGRWNSVGVHMVYTSATQSLALLEILANLEPGDPLPAYVAIEVKFDDAVFETVNGTSLPINWRDNVAPIELRGIGDEWARAQRSVVLRVPSAIVPAEYNYLLNPLHEGFSDLNIGRPQPFDFDPRLMK